MKTGKEWELPSKTQVLARLADETEEGFVKFLYWQQIAETFMAVVAFEASVINTMSMCNKIQIGEILGEEGSRAFAFMVKRKNLEESTLGNLIKILQKHKFDDSTLSYLKSVKNKRDYFIHRHFIKTPWPADISAEYCKLMIRRLIAIERILDRASLRIFKIFEREGFLTIHNIGKEGLLISNNTIWDEYEA